MPTRRDSATHAIQGPAGPGIVAHIIHGGRGEIRRPETTCSYQRGDSAEFRRGIETHGTYQKASAFFTLAETEKSQGHGGIHMRHRSVCRSVA
jgi:hypothetical protein